VACNVHGAVNVNVNVNVNDHVNDHVDDHFDEHVDVRDGAGARARNARRGEYAPTRGAGRPPLYTLNRKCMMSPSCTTYSLPSMRILPAALMAASEWWASRSASA
jgi:hypothetical protein